MSSGLAATLFVILVIFAALGDFLTFRIANRLNLAIMLSFFAAAWLCGMPGAVIGHHVLAGLAMLLAGFAAFRLGVFGGGDAKLMGAAALWLGPPGLALFLAGTAVAGLPLSLAVIGRAWACGTLRGSPRRMVLPYGVALAAGAIVAIPGSWWLSQPV